MTKQTIISPTGLVLDLVDQGDKRHVKIDVNRQFTDREVNAEELKAA